MELLKLNKYWIYVHVTLEYGIPIYIGCVCMCVPTFSDGHKLKQVQRKLLEFATFKFKIHDPPPP